MEQSGTQVLTHKKHNRKIMLRNLSSLEVKIGENLHQYICSTNTPTNEAKEALFQFLKYIGQIEDQAKAMQDEVKVESAPESELPKE